MTSLSCLHSLIINNLTSVRVALVTIEDPVLPCFAKRTLDSTYSISRCTHFLYHLHYSWSQTLPFGPFSTARIPCLTHDASSTTLFTYFRITGADRKLLTVSPLLQFSRRKLSSLVMDRHNEYRAVITIIKCQIYSASFFTCNCVFWR